MFSKFLKWLESLFKKKAAKLREHEYAAPKPAEIKPAPAPGRVTYKNTYRLCWNYNTQASIFLWGKDSQNNPAFVVLYGNRARGAVQTFTSYAIFRGAGGHFPSFDKVRIIERFDYKTRLKHTKMYYAKDVGRNYYYYVRGPEKNAVKDFYPLDGKDQVTFKPDPKLSYTDMLKRLNLTQIKLDNFILAANPADIMKLPYELARYSETFFDLFSNTNLYMRRKILRGLIQSNPPADLYSYILRVGSGELISGLFLELAMRRDPAIASEAENLSENDLNWLAQSHRNGVLRCAALYLDSLSDAARDARIRALNENAFIKGNKNIIIFKDAVQTAEIFSLADILGKMAAYLDTKKITFISKTRTKTYFNRDIRRIIDGYANTDEEKFILAMKAFLTNYEAADDASYNKTYFIKRYLYFDSGLNGKERRCELKPEIWDRHAEAVLEIASVIKAGVIAEPLYNILFDNKRALVSITYEKLIAAAGAPYAPTADMVMEILGEKLSTETEFKPELMILLAQCENARVQQLAADYLNAVGGKISSGTLVNYLFMRDLESKAGFIEENIRKFNAGEYLEFINSIYDNAALFAKQNVVWPESIADVLNNSLSVLNNAPAPQKCALTARILQDINKGALTDYLMVLGENIVFSMPFDDLRKVPFEYDPAADSGESARVCKLFMAIKDELAPDDGFIADVLENGSPRTVNALARLLLERKEPLKERLNTVLFLFESTVASLNELAKNIFSELTGGPKSKLLAMLLDSPDAKTYRFGMDQLGKLYGGQPIPAEYIKEMLEHSSFEVRSFVSGKVNGVINNLGGGNTDLFLYYAKTLLLLPNKVSSGKKNIYNLLPKFVSLYKNKRPEVEDLLLDIGGSNVISDSERALVALARIKEGDFVECQL